MDNVVTTVVDNTYNYAEEVEHYTDLIHTYGASTVIIAVFLVILLAILGYILRNNHKTNNQLIKQQQELVDMLLATKTNDKKDEDEEKRTTTVVKEPEIVQVFLDINSSMKEILKDIYDEIDTSRVAIYVFHNGVYSSHGLPFFKMSCVCEIIKKNCGVIKNINHHANLPLQMFDNSISYLYKHGKMTVANVEDENDELVHDSPVLIGMLKSNNIKSASGIVVYDHDNNILGILMAEFSEIKDTEFLNTVEQLLIEKAPLLSPILEYSGIYDATTK